MANNKITIETEIKVNDRGAQKQIENVEKGLSTLTGQKRIVKIKFDGLEHEQERLEKALNEISSKTIKDKNGKVLQIIDINSEKKALKILEADVASTTGRLQTRLRADVDRINEHLAASVAYANRKRDLTKNNRAVGGYRAIQNDQEEGRQSAIAAKMQRIRSIENSKEIADLKEVVRLRKDIVKLLEKSDKFKKINDQSPETVKAYAELGAAEKKLRMIREQNTEMRTQGGLLTKLKDLAMRYFGVYAAINFVNKMVEATKFFEQQKVALAGITKSAVEAEKLVSQIRGFAIKSPFTTQELTGFVKQLSAYNIATRDLFDTTKRLADISAGLGVDMGRIVLAFGQVKAATVLRGQELRQFTEAGVPMVEELAKKFTQLNGELVTTADVFELISKRQVSFEMVDQVLNDLTSEGGKFYKMQENLTNTLAGQIARLKDMWFMSLEDMGHSINGLMMGVVKVLQYVAQNIKGIFAGGAIAAAGVAMIKYAAQVNKVLKATLLVFKADTWTSWFSTMSKGFNSLIGHIKAFNRLLHMTNGSLNKLSLIMRATIAIIPAAWLGALLIGIGAIVTKVINASRELKQFNREWDELGTASAKETKKLQDGLDSLITRLNHATKDTKEYNDILSTLQQNYSNYITVNDKVIEQLRTMGDEYKNLKNVIKSYNDFELAQNRRQKLADAVKNDATMSDAGVKLWEGKGIKKSTADSWYYVLSNNGQEYGWTLKIPALQNELRMVYNDAVDEFLAEGFTEPEQFANIFKRIASGSISGLSDELEKNEGMLDDMMSKGFEMMSSSRMWNNYVDKTKQLNGDEASDSKIGILGAIRRAYKFDESSVSDDGGYTAWRDRVNQAYIERTKDLLGSRFAGINTKDGRLASDTQEYKDLMDALSGDYDLTTVRRVEELIEKFKGIFGPDAKVFATEMQKLFSETTDSYNNKPAAVRETIIEMFRKPLDSLTKGTAEYEKAEKKWNLAQQYLPTDETFRARRESLPKDKEEILSKLSSYGINNIDDPRARKKIYSSVKGGLSAQDQKAVDELLDKWEVIDDLMKGKMPEIKISAKDENGNPLEAQMFSIGTKIKEGMGGGGANREYPEFFNLFSNAYAQYKKMIQEGGTDFGVNEFKTNERLQKIYGAMFGGTGGEAIEGLKIGNTSIESIIKKNLIGDGLEKGIVDFKEAAKATAEELMEYYYKGDKKNRESFKRASEQITKWVADTFSRDEVDTVLKRLTKDLQDLSNTFEQTNKNVDTYRKLMQAGTADRFNGIFGSKEQALTPKSTRERLDIASMIAKYNENLPEGQKFSIGDINTPAQIIEVRNRLSDELKMNNDAFTANPEGKILLQSLVSALTKLDETMRNEATSLSGEAYTGSSLNDAIRNAIIKSGVSSDEEARLLEVAKLFPNVDLGAISKGRVSDATGIADNVWQEFMKDLDLDMLIRTVGTSKNARGQGITFGNSARGNEILFSTLEEKLKKIVDQIDDDLLKNELQSKFRDLKLEVLRLNAKSGDLNAIGDNISLIKNADQTAANEHARVVGEGLVNGGTWDAANNQFIIPETGITQEQKDILAQCNKELAEMGFNGEKLAKSLRLEGFQNIQNYLGAASKDLDVMKSQVTNVTAAFKSTLDVVRKVYDVMNDGKNPEGLEDTAAFIEDFSEAFEMCIAPIGAVIALIGGVSSMLEILAAAGISAQAALTPLLITMAAVVALAAIVAVVVAAFQQHDRSLEHQIDSLKEHVDETSRAMDLLNDAAGRMVGLEKMGTELEALGKNLENAASYRKMANLENDKKNTDFDKVKEYTRAAEDAEHEFLNSLKEWREEFVGTVESMADSMSSAMRSAFQNGENAARAMRDVVKQSLGDIVEEMLRMAVLEPLVQNAMDNLLGGSVEDIKKQYGYGTGQFDSKGYEKYIRERLSDEKALEQYEQDLQDAGTAYLDTYAGLSQKMKDWYAYNADQATLSGGIEGITEDTARTLEGLSNSILAQNVLQTGYLEMLAASGIAQVQISWFQGMLNLTRSIDSNTSKIYGILDDVTKNVKQFNSLPH